MSGSSSYTEFNFVPEIMNKIMMNVYIEKSNSIKQDVTTINTMDLNCEVIRFADSNGALVGCLEAAGDAASVGMSTDLVQSLMEDCNDLFDEYSNMCSVGGTITQENTLEMVITIDDEFEFTFEVLQDMVSEFDVEFDETTDALADMMDALLGSDKQNITTIGPKLRNSVSSNVTVEIMNKINARVLMRNELLLEHVGSAAGSVIKQSNVATFITAILTEHTMVIRHIQTMDTTLTSSYKSYQVGLADYIRAIGDMIGGFFTGKIGMAVAIPLLGIVITVVTFTALRGGGGGSKKQNLPPPPG